MSADYEGESLPRITAQRFCEGRLGSAILTWGLKWARCPSWPGRRWGLLWALQMEAVSSANHVNVLGRRPQVSRGSTFLAKVFITAWEPSHLEIPSSLLLYFWPKLSLLFSFLGHVWLCTPMHRSTPGLHVLHRPPDFIPVHALRWWWYLTISSSASRLLLLPSVFPSIRSFPMSWLLKSGGQNIGSLLMS